MELFFLCKASEHNFRHFTYFWNYYDWKLNINKYDIDNIKTRKKTLKTFKLKHLMLNKI